MAKTKTHPKIHHQLYMFNFAYGIIVGLLIFGLVQYYPAIDEFAVFNCVTTPCEVPKISIADYIDREYINPPTFQIPDCNIEAC